jgi:hypothetical protein
LPVPCRCRNRTRGGLLLTVTRIVYQLHGSFPSEHEGPRPREAGKRADQKAGMAQKILRCKPDRYDSHTAERISGLMIIINSLESRH